MPYLNQASLAAVAIALLSAAPSYAQVSSIPPEASSSIQASAPPRPQDPYAKFDDLAQKGWDVPQPKISDTLVKDAGGIRTAMADAGFGFLGLFTTSGVYNVLDNARPSRPIVYNGQKPSLNTGFAGVTLTYDASRIGLDGGQFILAGSQTFNGTERINGTRDMRIQQLAYFQSLLNGGVEVKIGYVDNAQEFLGTKVGGSISTGSLGPQASIPYQIGMSYQGGAPTLNVRINATKHLYTKIGLQRSFPPGGLSSEVAVNDLGLKFAPKGTGVLMIDEIGYNRSTGPNVKSLWVRGGGMFNTTNYTDFRNGGKSSNNWALFAAVDRQLTQPNGKLPFQGVYGGFTINYAPPQQNLFSQYYEGRVYGIGLLPSRPFDLASLVVSYTRYSRSARAAITGDIRQSYNDSAAIVASYSLRATSGLYIQPGIGYTLHPSYAPRFKPALNAYLSLTALL